MSHLIPGSDVSDAGTAPTRRFREARLVLSAALTRQAAAITGRSDLVVKTVTATAVGAPGLFYPDQAAIELQAALFEKPPKGRRAPAPKNPTTRPVGFGVFIHETGHATHTRWRRPDGTGPAHAEAAMLLEEIRIEGAHVRRRPDDRHWLRHSTKTLILADSTDASAVATAWNAAHTLALVSGRVDAGILTPAEAHPVATSANRLLGPTVVRRLRAIWLRVLGIDDHDADAMLQAGAEWCTVLDVDPHGPDPARQQGPATQAQARTATATARAIRSSLANITKAVAAEPTPNSRDAPPGSKLDPGGVAAALTPLNGPGSPITGQRPPSPEEIRQAAVLSQRLRSAGLRERATVTVASTMPPGRLDMRAALARDAQKAAGAVQSATPWRHTTRKSTYTPPLRVAIAADVSKSMRHFTDPAASTAWILAQATRRAGLDATSATVTFGGTTITPITRPGRAPTHVTTFTAEAVGHPLADAIDTLDRTLGLTRPGAARLLVIVSDGHFRNDERTSAQARIERLRHTGCAVLWIAGTQQRPCPLPGTQLAAITDPATIGAAIGNAAVKALTP